jgi:Ala-tRNA(Pro) deacylase
MAANRLTQYLDEHRVKYVSIRHSPAYTAAEVAMSAHVPARSFAKTIIIKIDDVPEMLVLPASRRILIHELREMLETEHVKLASEHEIRELFPDCELGAMPPFGPLYGMKVHVTAGLTQEKEITFNAGTHTETITMAYADFEKLVQPAIIDMVTA